MRIVCSVDDGTIQDLQVVELLAKYGLLDICTMYWPVMPEVVNGFKGRKSLSLDQMQDISGVVTVGSHTLTHKLLTRIPLEEARIEIFKSREVLQQRFDQEILSFAYPRGYSRPEVQRLVQEAGYTSARGVTVGYIHESENRFDMQTTVHVGYQRKEYGKTKWLDYALYMLNLARNTPDSVYHFWGHSFEIDQNNAWGDLEILLKEVSNG